MKPTVKIKDCAVVTQHNGNVLSGIPVDHPRGDLNGFEVFSSPIAKIDGNSVETKNTNYEVINWLTPLPQPNA